MPEAPKSLIGRYADGANDLSTMFAELLPRDNEMLDNFIFPAALALGAREADLARELGVSRATLSSWKARGSIPAPYLRWFCDEFVYSVLTRGSGASDIDALHAGMPAVLRLYRETDFNPFRLPDLDTRATIEVCYRYMGRLARLAQFVQLRTDLLVIEPEQIEVVSAATTGRLAAAAAARLFPVHRVSHSVSQ